jgi:hypothetical protein
MLYSPRGPFQDENKRHAAYLDLSAAIDRELPTDGLSHEHDITVP